MLYGPVRDTVRSRSLAHLEAPDAKNEDHRLYMMRMLCEAAITSNRKLHHAKCATTYKLRYTKVPIKSTCVVSHTRASVYIEVDVRRNKKHVYSFLYSTIVKWGFFARDKTLLGAIWIILVL